MRAHRNDARNPKIEDCEKWRYKRQLIFHRRIKINKLVDRAFLCAQMNYTSRTAILDTPPA